MAETVLRPCQLISEPMISGKYWMDCKEIDAVDEGTKANRWPERDRNNFANAP
jgi:hypothetical protein